MCKFCGILPSATNQKNGIPSPFPKLPLEPLHKEPNVKI